MFLFFTKMTSHKSIILSVFVALFCESYAKFAPDYITPCPGLKSDCLKKNIQETIPHFVKGIPSLGINSTDPLYQKRVDLELPGGLKIEFYDGVLTGFRKCIVDSASYEGDDATLEFTCSLSLKGKYKAIGHILIFSINGDGDAKIKTPSVSFKCKIKFEDRTHDGIVHREIKDYKVTYIYNDRVSFVFTNLFRGNPELSQTVLTFLNENWKQVIDEFGKPVVDAVIRFTFNIIKQFFRAVPKDELFTP